MTVIDYCEKKTLLIIFVLVVACYPLVSILTEVILENNQNYFSIFYRFLILFLSLFCLGVRFYSNKKTRLAVGSYFWLLFWFFYLFRLFIDTSLYQEDLSKDEWEYLFYAIGGCFIPGLAFILLGFESKYDSIDLLIKLLAFSMLFQMLLIINQHGILSVSELMVIRGETRTLNPISLGHYSVSLIMLSLIRLFHCQKKYSYLFFGVSLFIGIAGLLVSGSRGPLLSLLAMFLVFIFFKKKGLILFLSFFVIVISFFYSFVMDEIYFFNRVSTSLFDDDARLGLLESAYEMFIEFPVYGAGIEPLSTYPHNFIVESFLALGLFGGLVFLILLTLTFLRAVNLLLYSEAYWLSLLFIQYVVASLFSGALYNGVHFWILSACILSSPKNTNNKIRFSNSKRKIDNYLSR